MTAYPFDASLRRHRKNHLLDGAGPSPDFSREMIHRIGVELEQSFEMLSDVDHCVSIFGSARVLPNHPDYTFAYQLARKLGESGVAVMTGGGPGIMEAANRGAHESGSASIGLHVELPFEQETNHYVDLGLRLNYLFTRKVIFIRYSEAFIVFPGGFGTLDELFEVLMLMQTGKTNRRRLILVRSEYWQGLSSWLDQRVLRERMISSSDLEMISFADSLDDVVSATAAISH